MTPFEISPANRRFIKFEGEFLELPTNEDAERLCTQLNRLMAKRACVHHASQAQRVLLDSTQLDQLTYWYGDQPNVLVQQHQQRDHTVITSASLPHDTEQCAIVLEAKTPFPFVRQR